MAENLLRYAFPRQDKESVASIYDKINSYSNNTQHDLDELVQELQDILTEVKKREDIFYQKLQVSNYKELKTKLDSLNRDYSFLLAGGSLITEVRRRYEFKKIQRATPQEIMEAVQDTLDEFIQNNSRQVVNAAIAKIEGDALNSQHGAALSRYIQEKLRLEDTKNKTRRFVTSRGGERVGLGKLVIGYDMRTGKPKLDADGVIFSSDFVKKMEAVLEGLSDKRGNFINAFGMSKEAFKDQIDSLIIEMAPSSIKENLREVITRGGIDKQFDLNRSIASVTGYCGEVRATAILNQISGGINARGTGALRDDLHKREIPIDIVCLANGFQIKNYTLNGKEVTFSNTLSALSWVEGRLRLTGTLRDILIDLFGTYQFNQPFSTAGDKELKAKQEDIDRYREQYYNKLYGADNSLFYKFVDIFDARVPTMLKIYENFSVTGDSDFDAEQLYFNTFFLINKHLVPSSVIIDELIKQLSKKDNKIINTKYTIYEPNRKFSLQKSPNLLHTSSMEAMAKKLKIEYEINIQLPSFV